MSERKELRLDEAEARERRLRLTTLVLLMLLAAVTVIALAVVVGPASPDPASRTLYAIALGGLLLVTALFCGYAVRAHAGFDKIRRLYRQGVLKDPLTGLLNRFSFNELFETEVRRAERSGESFPILLCDLDHFKQVNDSRGHQFGDRVLELVAQAFLKATRGSDLVFRWGGDEFLVVLSSTTAEGALIAARRIRDGVRAIGQEHQLALDLSIGVAFYPEHAADRENLISLADRALYISKTGADKIHVGPQLYEAGEESVRMVLQPVVEIGSRKVVGYEALSRDPAGKLKISDVFQRHAAVGQLAELKKIIFRQQVERAGELGLDRVFVNIDFATLQAVEPFAKPDAVEVVLEISEIDSLRNANARLTLIGSWRELGYKFAIDDFGSGLMSLPFIARLVPDCIKVDRTMLVQASSSEEFGHFLRDLLQAIRTYSRDGIIAEGIETEEEYETAREMGADQVQGFLTGLPEEPD